MKKIIALLMVVCIAFSFCGCVFLKDVADSTKKEQPKTFEFEDISIELTSDFLRMDFLSDEYDFVVGTKLLTVMGIKAEFDENTEVSVNDYADAFRSALTDNNTTPISYIEEIPTLQYQTKDNDGNDQKVAVMFYKGTNCFWVICFAASIEKFDDIYNDICKYAKTVKCE